MRKIGSITILGLLQTLALVFGIFFTAVFLKYSAPLASTLPTSALPFDFVVATRFANYRFLFTFLILAWIVWASRVKSDETQVAYPVSLPFVTGILLFILIVAIGVLCSIWATIPTWTI